MDKISYYICYECGCKEYGTPQEGQMDGITVHQGDCPVCGKKGVTMIPRSDFTMPGWD